jgi:hypothetical protein
MSRSAVTVNVTCDLCSETVELELSRNTIDVDATLKRMGWGSPNDDDTLDLCPVCMRESDDDGHDDDENC